MPSRHKTPLVGWHPKSAENVAWLRFEAERTGHTVTALLDEALTVYRAFAEAAREGPGWPERLAATLEGRKSTTSSG